MVEWSEKTLTGFPITNVAFNQNNSLVATSSDSAIIVHNIRNPKLKVTAESSDEIITLVFSSIDELISVSKSGELIIWNVTSDFLTVKSTRRVTAFTVKDVVFAAEGRESIWLIREGEVDSLFFLIGDQSLEKLCNVEANLVKGQLALGDGFAVYCNGKMIHLIPTEQDSNLEAHSFQYVGTLNNGTAKENIANVIEKVVVSKDIVVAALSVGMLLIWHDVDQKGLEKKNNMYHQRHWHKSAPVVALTPFSGLLSAGAETVLCKWTLEGSASPTMLPRLAGPVDNLVLSPDGSLLALLLEDNSLQIISVASMTFSKNIPTVSWCKRSPNNVFTSDPLSNKLVLNSKPGSIQWLDPSSGETEREARITLENAVDGEMPGLVTVYHEIERVVLTETSAGTLTSIVNFAENHKRLRFWRRCKKDFSVLELQETVAVSNRTKFLAGCARPVSDEDKVFATCSDVGEIIIYKQWQEGERWRQDTARNRRWHTSNVRCVSEIQTGPVWATAHVSNGGDNIVIWDVSNMTVVDVIPTDGIVSSIQWANSSHCIFATNQSVTCWNINAGLLVWTVQQSLLIHCSPHGCFAWDDMQVLQFDPFTGRLLESLRFSVPVCKLEVIPVADSSTSFYLAAKANKGFHIMSPPLTAEGPSSPQDITPFGALLASVREAETVKVAKPQKAPNALELMGGPCHTLPPLSHIAPMFISSCLAPASPA